MMGKKIVCAGRGGVGKTSFIAGISLALKKFQPLLIIDADPDESLASLLGPDLKFKTISEVLFNIKEGKVEDRVKGLSLPERIDYLLQQDSLYEGDFFDFLSLGVKWSEGCYCQPNNILKAVIQRIERNYNFILIDSPAGLEHINRRITSTIDYLFILLEPSKKSFDSVGRFSRLLEELKIRTSNIFIVANHRFPEEDLRLITDRTGIDLLGKLPYDKEVEKINLEGKPLSGLSDGSPFFNQIRNILKLVKVL